MDGTYLKTLVDEKLSIREIADKTNKSPTSIRYWLKRHGLKTKIARFNRGGLANKTKKNQKDFFCESCGENDSTKFYKARGRCKACHNKRQMDYVRKLKRKAVEYKGGECQECGYKKNYAALDFHHLNPKEKDVNWNTSRHWSWNRLVKELDKCVLVCHNCHAEIHYPDHFE